MSLTVLPATLWRDSEARHVDRVRELTSGHRMRAGRGIPHPVEDFLFTYYSLRPAQLRRWYPGVGVALADAAERAGWRFHRVLPAGAGAVTGAGATTGAAGAAIAAGGSVAGSDAATVAVDVPAFLRARGSQVDFTRRLLAATSAAPGQFG
jgi:hypothetical protein